VETEGGELRLSSLNDDIVLPVGGACRGRVWAGLLTEVERSWERVVVGVAGGCG
jgi:hypothetical protein